MPDSGLADYFIFTKGIIFRKNGALCGSLHPIMPQPARSPTGFGKCPVTEEIEAVLRKIEHWHEGPISSFKILCRDGKGFWHAVRWDGKSASLFALQETDERKASKKLLAGA